MSTLSTPPPGAARPGPLDWSLPDHLRFTRDGYHKMGEVGLLDQDASVELLNGEIVPMSPIGPRHLSVTDKLNEFFVPRLAGRVICRNQGSQATDNYSEPEPDYQLLKRIESYYSNTHPRPEDVLLVIEVSDSSLKKDLGPKMQIYAAAGIVEYWVIDLVNRKLLVHTKPDQAKAEYRSVVTHDDNATVAPGIAEDCGLDLAWLFGPKTPPSGVAG